MDFTPDIIAKLTVKEESIDDALLAAQLLRQTQGIDPKRIYVLGHSLGATVAPRIGQQDSNLAGLIIMAGMTIPLEDEVLRQIEYLNNLSGSPTDQQKADFEKLKAAVARVKDPSLSDKTPASDLPLGVSPAYWLDLRGYKPAEVAKALAMPLLIQQGERDYQVTPDQDFTGWKTTLAQKSNVVFKLYPGLNHLFILGQGKPNPSEYETPGHVSADVVKDIVDWIKGK
jgi:dienelactone hydrolase